MQFYSWDGFTLLDGPVVVQWGALLGIQGTKPLSRPIVLAQAVSSLPVEPYDAVHSLKKPHETGQVTRQLVARD